MSTPTKLTLVPGPLTKRGQVYSVLLGDDVIVARSYDPEHAACRALVAKGFTGSAEFWSQDIDHPRMLIRDIEKAAQFTVSESGAHGPRVIPYEPFPTDRFDDHDTTETETTEREAA